MFMLNLTYFLLKKLLSRQLLVLRTCFYATIILYNIMLYDEMAW